MWQQKTTHIIDNIAMCFVVVAKQQQQPLAKKSVSLSIPQQQKENLQIENNHERVEKSSAIKKLKCE
jgi:hypothetical protein